MDTAQTGSPTSALIPDTKRKRRQFQRQSSKRNKTSHEPAHLSAGTFQCFALNGDSVNFHRRSTFSKERKKEVKGVRRKGACLRCRLLKRSCSGEDPCKTCIVAAKAAVGSRSLMWMDCIRPSFQAINIFDAGTEMPDQIRVNQILDDLLDDDVYLDFHLPWDLNVDAASALLASWLSDDHSPSTFSVVGVFSCSTNTNLLKNSLDPALARDLRLFVHLTTHLYTTGMQGGYQEYTDDEIRSVRDCVGNRLLQALDPLLRPTELEGTEDKLAKLKSLFLLLLGTTVGMRYTCPDLVDGDHEGFEGHDADPKQAALLRLLCHYLIYIGKVTSLIEASSDEKTLVKKWKCQWNKPAAFTWNYSTGLEMHYRIQPHEDWIVSSSEDESMSSIDLDLDDFDFDSLEDADEFTVNTDLHKCAGCGTFWANLDTIGVCQKCQSALNEDWMNQLSVDVGTTVASSLEVSHLNDQLRALSETTYMDNWFDLDAFTSLGTDLAAKSTEQDYRHNSPNSMLPTMEFSCTPELDYSKVAPREAEKSFTSPDCSDVPAPSVRRCTSCLSRGVKYGYHYPVCAGCRTSEFTVTLSESSDWDSIQRQGDTSVDSDVMPASTTPTGLHFAPTNSIQSLPGQTPYDTPCSNPAEDADPAKSTTYEYDVPDVFHFAELKSSPSTSSSHQGPMLTQLRKVCNRAYDFEEVEAHGPTAAGTLELASTGWRSPSFKSAFIKSSVSTIKGQNAATNQTSESFGGYHIGSTQCTVCDHIKDAFKGCCKVAGEFHVDSASGLGQLVPEDAWSCGQCANINLIQGPPTSSQASQGNNSTVRRQHHKDSEFRCPISFCTRRCRSEKELQRHLGNCPPRAHTRTDFTCQPCCQSFHNAKFLREHQKVCPQPICDEQTDLSHLDVHSEQRASQVQEPKTYAGFEVFRSNQLCPSYEGASHGVMIAGELSTTPTSTHEWSQNKRKVTFACGHVARTTAEPDGASLLRQPYPSSASSEMPRVGLICGTPPGREDSWRTLVPPKHPRIIETPKLNDDEDPSPQFQGQEIWNHLSESLENNPLFSENALSVFDTCSSLRYQSTHSQSQSQSQPERRTASHQNSHSKSVRFVDTEPSSRSLQASQLDLETQLAGRKLDVLKTERFCYACKDAGLSVPGDVELPYTLPSTYEWSQIERKVVFACGHVGWTLKTKVGGEEGGDGEGKSRLLI
ncbi:hypothetical protein K491DRAFT_753337 [Lophiostoma macrostomum CBS 122681]|uniref:Uncharacterized protein n=1 Tax=Lophiostoma macrostomum CBS 122681 TaxID=1314788 RepID=A0A6A6TQ58_9PLEO|nr:hypothetical protein K491DRAFT_753337 [Lophiostoma macrostomum CBS 122681]